MSDWVVSNIANGEEVSSIISNNPVPAGSPPVPQNASQPSQVPIYQSQPIQPQVTYQPTPPPAPVAPEPPLEEESQITHLGSSYKINNVTVTKSRQSVPSWLLAVVVVIPLVLIFIMGAISNKESKKPEESFLFKTLESRYFSLNYSPDYEATSIIDKKVPFIEKHDLISNIDGEKAIHILVKDVKFDYSLDNNINVKTRREKRDLYAEEIYELGYKQGLYFKKRTENFDHLILLVDRGKSVLYEISIQSPSSFADDDEMQAEVKEMLESVTFL